MAYRIIQNHNGDDCLGQRNYHPHKILEHVAAVDLRSLLQLQRQRIYKKGAAQYQVEYGKRAKYHQYIGRIGEMQPFDNQIGGNQATGEILGDDQQLHDNAPARHIRPGKGIACRNGEEQGNQRTEQRIPDGVVITCPNPPVAQDITVALPGNPFGKKKNLPGGHQLRAAHRCNDNEPQRVKHRQCKQYYACIDNCQKYLIRQAQPFKIFHNYLFLHIAGMPAMLRLSDLASYHRLFSEVRRAIVLTARSSSRFITLLKTLIAAE